MALFMLDTDSIDSVSSSVSLLKTKTSNIGENVGGYNVANDDGFDFASAVQAISTNLNNCSIRLENTQKVLDAVVSSHNLLQQSMIYSPKYVASSLAEPVVNSTNTPTGESQGNAGNGDYDNGGYYGGGGGPSDSKLKKLALAKLEKDLLDKRGNEVTKVVVDLQLLSTLLMSSIDMNNIANESKELFENNKISYNTNGYALIGDKYVISCDESYGKVGDEIIIISSSGLNISCIIGFTTSNQDKSKVDFVVNESYKKDDVNNITNGLEKEIFAVYNGGKIVFENKTASEVKTVNKETTESSSSIKVTNEDDNSKKTEYETLDIKDEEKKA